MLLSMNDLIGYRLHAADGNIGRVHDFYFDDQIWGLRYIVADTGAWLPGRLVLLAPEAVERPVFSDEQLRVSLTKEAIERSPSIAEDLPVSRRLEADLAQYYGWSAYWTAALPRPQTPEEAMADGDPHLRSLREVRGYRIEATDGTIGHVEDALADSEVWFLRYFVIDTRNWLPGGRKVLIGPNWVERVDWAARAVDIDHAKQEVEESPAYEGVDAVNRPYEERIHQHFRKPPYWGDLEHVPRGNYPPWSHFRPDQSPPAAGGAR
ncbi:MAG: PRC-barrel domain-containing protein [Planctomycetota bacterium]